MFSVCEQPRRLLKFPRMRITAGMSSWWADTRAARSRRCLPAPPTASLPLCLGTGPVFILVVHCVCSSTASALHQQLLSNKTFLLPSVRDTQSSGRERPSRHVRARGRAGAPAQLGNVDAVYRRFTAAREAVLREATPGRAQEAFCRLLPQPSRWDPSPPAVRHRSLRWPPVHHSADFQAGASTRRLLIDAFGVHPTTKPQAVLQCWVQRRMGWVMWPGTPARRWGQLCCTMPVHQF